MDRHFKSVKPSKVAIISVFSLIVVLFLSYINFLKPVDELGKGGPEKSIIERIFDKLGNSDDQEGQIDELAAADVRGEADQVAGASTENLSMWTATDYIQGDIQTGTYTVKSGDTLWEIAEATYGDGSQWHKILDANKDKVGYLPNGSQALIVTGQTLNLP